MKLLITGTTGFIGRNLVRAAESQGHHVVAVNRTSLLTREGNCQSLELPGWPEQPDIPEWSRRIADSGPFDAVIHLAGDPTYGNGEHYFTANTTLTQALVDSLSTFEPRPRFVYASSVGASDYLTLRKPSLRLESDVPYPRSDYGRSKLKSERLLQENASNYAIARLGMVFGKEMRSGSHLRVLARQVETKWRFHILRHLGGSMPLVHIDDAVAALLLLAESDVNGIFNVVGVNLGISTVVDALSGKLSARASTLKLGRIGTLLPTKVAAVTTPVLQFDYSKLQDLGWKPSSDYQELVAQFAKDEEMHTKLVSIVTGCASGLGRALFSELDAQGHLLLGVDQNSDAIEKMRIKFPDQNFLQADVTTANLLHQLLQLIERQSRACGDLYLIAGIGAKGQIISQPEETIRSQFEVNFFSRVRMTIDFIKRVESLPDSRRVVLISSSTALQPLGQFGVYSASNAALLSFGRVLITELEGCPTRVHVVVPGGMRTSFQDSTGVLRPKFDSLLDPRDVARRIVRMSGEPSKVVILGRNAHLTAILARCLPLALADRTWARLSKKFR